MNRAVKYLTAGSKPAFWAALAKGVMPAVEHIQAIKTLHPKTLIDVGANKGQFSLIARYLFPDIEIHAFEPLEKERSLFSSVVHGNTKLYPVALAAETSTREFFVASRRDSSSLLRKVSRSSDFAASLLIDKKCSMVRNSATVMC